MPRIDEYQYYHGGALVKLAEHASFTSINKPPNVASRSSYLVNHNTALYIKHSTAGQNDWRFTFAPEHQEEICRLAEQFGDRTYIVLVCSNLVCLVHYDEYVACIDSDDSATNWLNVYRPDGGGFRLRGSQGELNRVIPLNGFPRKIFE